VARPEPRSPLKREMVCGQIDSAGTIAGCDPYMGSETLALISCV
jgi:hypothetical protein